MFQRNAVKVGYNVQVGSDAKYKLPVAIDTGDVNDSRTLNVMTKKVQENLDIKEFDALADTGYHAGRELKACKEDGITTYVSPKQGSFNSKNKVYPLSKFTYAKQADTYTCPQGESLNTNGTWYRKTQSEGRKPYQFEKYHTKACATCPLKQH